MKFGVSWPELMETPLDVIYQDLEIAQIEEDVVEWEKSNKPLKNRTQQRRGNAHVKRR